MPALTRHEALDITAISATANDIIDAAVEELIEAWKAHEAVWADNGDWRFINEDMT